MSYKIEITNSGNHTHNPLLKLANAEYATREEACQAIYSAMFDVIDCEGCEMIYKGDFDDGSEYLQACEDYIKREGYASEDGVSASVVEIA